MLLVWVSEKTFNALPPSGVGVFDHSNPLGLTNSQSLKENTLSPFSSCIPRTPWFNLPLLYHVAALRISHSDSFATVYLKVTSHLNFAYLNGMYNHLLLSERQNFSQISSVNSLHLLLHQSHDLEQRTQVV